MTAVIWAAEAPRAASIIRSSSIRCSCVGGTSGCTMYTSRWRQLASSCAWRQSLLNRLMSTGERATPRCEQIRSASAGCADPLNTTTSFTSRPSLMRPACARTLSDPSGTRVGCDPVDELSTGGLAHVGGSGEAHEAVGHPGVVGVPRLDLGSPERGGVGDTLVAERVEVGRLDECRWQAAEVGGVQGGDERVERVEGV